MPKTVARKKQVQTPAPVAPPVPAMLAPEPAITAEQQPPRKAVYDKLGIVEYSSTSKHGPLTVDDAKTMLGWETEKEYKGRMVQESPGSKPEAWMFGEFGPTREDTGRIQPIHCVNTNKEKVVCWNNANNRPFDMSWCEDLVHTILYGQWAGPLTIPGETVNGETVRISRYARVLSGQHQATALILADELLQKSRAQSGNAADPKYPFWNGHDHPVIETIVITGLSEDERVLRSIDYVKPRTTADMLYTMELFRKNTPVERKEMTRMLASAIDLLWTRTDTKGYRTHPEIVGFLERHKRLLRCVEHLFIENNAKGNEWECKKCRARFPTNNTGMCKEEGAHDCIRREARRISNLRLSTGHASALCYLMGCGTEKTTEYSDIYRNESPPSEANLDWGYWDRAKQFWTDLAASRDLIKVRQALGQLVDSTPGSEDNQGLGGRAQEKFAIIAKAWEQYKDHPASAGPPFTDEDLEPGGILCLSYSDLDDEGNPLPDGRIKLLDTNDFYGIDCPESTGSKTKGNRQGTPMPPAPTREEIEKATREALERRTAQNKKR